MSYVIKRTVTYYDDSTLDCYFIQKSFMGREFTTKVSNAKAFATKKEAKKVLSQILQTSGKKAKFEIIQTEND